MSKNRPGSQKSATETSNTQIHLVANPEKPTGDDDSQVHYEYLGDLKIVQVRALLDKLTNTNQFANSINNIRKVLDNNAVVRLLAGFTFKPNDPKTATDAEMTELMARAESQWTATPEKAFADPRFVHLLLTAEETEEEGGAE
jgi:hypothetical protein